MPAHPPLRHGRRKFSKISAQAYFLCKATSVSTFHNFCVHTPAILEEPALQRGGAHAPGNSSSLLRGRAGDRQKFPCFDMHTTSARTHARPLCNMHACPTICMYMHASLCMYMYMHHYVCSSLIYNGWAHARTCMHTHAHARTQVHDAIPTPRKKKLIFSFFLSRVRRE